MLTLNVGGYFMCIMNTGYIFLILEQSQRNEVVVSPSLNLSVVSYVFFF